jgi:cobyrinic acid a,c-diamide synthase
VVARLVVAAPSSGCGKTTVATGLMAAFTDAGLAVSPHKAGPDYIDPGYHAEACGRPGRNLDPYLCGEQRVAPLFLHGAAGCELAVVEGVMGLFDGAAGRGGLGSTAQVARLLRAPVVLVVDASSQSRSVAALVHGFATFEPGVRVAAVVLNKVGSARHEAMLRDALEEVGVPCAGALPREAALTVPSRHLGLVPAAERASAAREFVRAARTLARERCDLDLLLGLARSAGPLDAEPWDPASEVAASTGRGRGPAGGVAEHAADGGAFGRRARDAERNASDPDVAGRPVVAVARGAAFSFHYAEQAELLAAAGAEVVPFDPLADEALPEGARGLVLGGGFPEVYADELAGNAALREGVRAFRGPVAAECAGLLYLGRELDGRPMCGRLPLAAAMTERLTLGYREAVALGDGLAAAGTRVRGHEFHRTAATPAAGTSPAWGFTHPERRTEGFTEGEVHASYLHLHWAAEPSLASRFVERCAAWA